MSVKVNQVTKLYGTQKALDRVSFELGAGEIVGFLGPNGAGKSTMMKIITCYIPQTSGTVNVCGYDVVEEALEVKKNIGYLPEHNPLYLDMYVKEYLSFVAGIYGIKKNVSKKVAEVIGMVGLEIEQHKKIGALSKGYRQRVGLSQALIHDPKVLILDEPTTGLDPNQIVDIRNLIKQVGRQKTVMLSTHIMQEVKAICDRIIIINKGKIATDISSQEISKQDAYKQVITVEFDKQIDALVLENALKAQSVKHISGSTYKVLSNSQEDMRKALFNFAVQHEITILSQQQEEQSLEEVFRKLTKK